MTTEIQYTTENGVVGFDPRFYPDGSPLVTQKHNQDIKVVMVRARSFASFMAALFWIDALAQRSVYVENLILPFFPGARQDRLNEEGDQLFTAKSVAELINFRQFRTVTILDPHSDVVPAMVNRSQVIHAADCIKPPPGKYTAVISPDAGSEKRAMRVAKRLGVPLFHAWKTRDITTGKISGFGIEDMPTGGLSLIVDDICDGGGTFLGLADKLKGPAHLWTTHGLYTNGTAALLERFPHIYCTDSVFGPRDGVIEIKKCNELLEQP